jgi:hypothetical protein
MQRDAAIGMNGRVDVLTRAERRDDDRRLPFHGQRDVLFEARIGLVDDLIDRERRGGLVGMIAVPGREFLGDAMQPFIEQRRGPRVQRRKRADDPRLALRNDQIGIGDEKQRRADGGEAELVAEDGREGHGSLLSLVYT